MAKTIKENGIEYFLSYENIPSLLKTPNLETWDARNIKDLVALCTISAKNGHELSEGELVRLTKLAITGYKQIIGKGEYFKKIGGYMMAERADLAKIAYKITGESKYAKLDYDSRMISKKLMKNLSDDHLRVQALRVQARKAADAATTLAAHPDELYNSVLWTNKAILQCDNSLKYSREDQKEQVLLMKQKLYDSLGNQDVSDNSDLILNK